MSSTNYEIRLRYRLDGKDAVKGADALSKRLDGLSSMVKSAGMAVAGYFGAQAAGKALIGFNATVEETKNQIAGMFALTKKTNLSDELENADRMYANLQKRAMSLPGTTEEYAKFASLVTRSVTDAGLGMKDLEDITVNAVVAAKSFGEEAEVAARDIDQLMSGRFNTTDPFSSKLLGSMGYATEEGRKKVREMSKAQRAELLKTALAQKQITQLADAQGATFQGRLSTVQDTLQQLAGKAGAPLFEALKKELENIAKWFEVNKDKVQEFTKAVGEGLVKAFSFLKDVFGFIANNAGTLIRVAGAFAAIKVANFLGGAIGGIGGALSGLRNSMASSPRAFSGGEGGAGIGKSLGGIVTAGSVGWELGAALREATGGATAWSDRMSGLFGAVTPWSKATYDSTRAIERWNESLDESTRKAREAMYGKGPVASSGANTSLLGNIGQYEKERDLIQAVLATQKNSQLNPYAYEAAKLAAKKMDIGGSQFSQKGLDAINAKIATDKAKTEYLQSDAAYRAFGEVSKGVGPELAKYLDDRRGGTEDVVTRALSTLYSQYGRPATPQEILAYIEQGNQGYKPIAEQIANFAQMIPLAGGPLAELTKEIAALFGDKKGAIKADEKAAGKGNVSVTVNKIEVQNDDPERYAFDLNAAFSKAARNPSRAKSYFKGAR